MPTYTVHEPQPVAEDIDERATRLVFVKEGFAWLAFLAPLLWLLYHRLWLSFLLFVVVMIGTVVLVQLAGGNANAVGWASALVNLAFGFEARNVQRWALSRKGYALIGVVTGRDLEDAERRFLSEWLPAARGQAKRFLTGPSASQSQGGPIPIMGTGMAHG